VSSVLEPLADTKLVLGGTEESWDITGVLTAVVQAKKNLDLFTFVR
jgi:hypothetical protein